MRLFDRLSHQVDLRVPYFESTVPPGRVRQKVFAIRDTREWFAEFVTRAASSIGRAYLPVHRISDGEMSFAVGFRPPYPPLGVNPVIHYVRQVASYVKWRRWSCHLSTGTPDGCEEYSGVEWRQLRQFYTDCVRQLVAANGILAVALCVTPERFGEQYHRAMCEWFERHGIDLNAANYYPFYFVYALLNSPARDLVLKDRSVLVINSLTPERQRAIQEGLEKAGARQVQFRAVSRSKALHDTVELSTLSDPVDVALIGAGVASASILLQLKPLQTLSIDAGYCIDLLAYPELAGKRDFTLSAPAVSPMASL